MTTKGVREGVRRQFFPLGKYNSGKRCTEAGGGLPCISFHLNAAGPALSFPILRVVPDDVVHELLVPGAEGSGFAVGQDDFRFQAFLNGQGHKGRPPGQRPGGGAGHEGDAVIVFNHIDEPLGLQGVVEHHIELQVEHIKNTVDVVVEVRSLGAGQKRKLGNLRDADAFFAWGEAVCGSEYAVGLPVQNHVVHVRNVLFPAF